MNKYPGFVAEVHSLNQAHLALCMTAISRIVAFCKKNRIAKIDVNSELMVQSVDDYGSIMFKKVTQIIIEEDTIVLKLWDYPHDTLQIVSEENISDVFKILEYLEERYG